MEDGDGDGDMYVSIETFNQFKSDNAALCRSYREHVETKILGVERKIDVMEQNISSKVKIVGAVISIIVGVLTLINLYLSVVI